MRYIRKIVTFGLLVLLITVGAAQVSGDQGICWKTYHNGKYGWSMEYPAGWTVKEIVPSNLIRFRSTCFVDVITQEGIPNLEEFADEREEALRERYVGYTRISKKKAILGGERAIEIIASHRGTDGSVPQRTRAKFIAKGGIGYATIGFSDTYTYGIENEKYFEPMMQSFNLEGLQAPPREEVEKIAVLPLRGSIAETAPSSYLQRNTTFITPETVKDNLDKAADDSQVKAVILRINSPGGSSAASQEISAMIKKFRQETSKPIVVSMADTATSGAYYISVYADRIIANPSTITGGIGVKFTVSNMEELYKKLGIEMEIIKSGEHEDIGYRPLTKEEKEILQDVCDQAHGQFIRAVAEGRGISEEEVRKIATGRIYLGQEALELGLIDELGGLDRAIEIACELAEIEKPIVERYEVSGMVPFPEISPSSLSEDELLLMIANYQAELCY